ncbi:MAG: chalcone isomerase family protein [Burkholderiaceae bacterium]
MAVRRFRLSLAAALTASALLLPGVADAAGTTETDAPACLRELLPQAHAAGEGSYRWFGIRVYDARLWTGPAGPVGLIGAAPGDAPFALELRYARDLDGRKIAEASLREMDKVAAPEPAQRDAWLARMTALFPDVHDGTRLTGIYRPGGPTVFCLDGRRFGSIDDPAFGRAFFAIWLSPRTSAPDLRAALLGAAAR